MASGTVVRVDRIVTDADMRLTRKLAMGDWPIFNRLTRGHVVLLINRAQTMARVVDCERGIYTFYARKGEVFDVAECISMVEKRTLNVGLSVVAGKRTTRKPHPGLSLGPPKAKKAA